MQPKFGVEEKVLCYHGPLLYEAKILKMKKETGIYTYFVHYQGWNKNWDEWVTESRMLKQIPESYEKQKKLLASHVAQTKANKKAKKDASKTKGTGKGGSDSNSNSRASTPVGERQPGRPSKRAVADDEVSTSSRDEEVQINPPSGRDLTTASSATSVASSTGGSTRGRKPRKEGTTRGGGGGGEEEPALDTGGVLSDEVMDTKISIDMPTELKYVLCNDWDLVVNQKKLFTIPAKVTVNNIIDQYIAHLSSQEASLAKKSVAAEIVRGLGEYFNVSVGAQLLFAIEKLQYKEDCESKGAVQPSDIYGSAHLLRLMVRIGGYLSSSPYSEASCKVIEEHLEEFLAYLDMNKSMFFQSRNYTPAGQDYLTRTASLKLL